MNKHRYSPTSSFLLLPTTHLNRLQYQLLQNQFYERNIHEVLLKCSSVSFDREFFQILFEQ